MKKSFLTILLFVLSASIHIHAQIITTLAGDGYNTHTGDGGPASAATLVTPFGVAVDSRGNIFVGEYTDYVRKIDHFGMISTIAGGGAPPIVGGSNGDGGPATAAYLDVIRDLQFDASDNLYMTCPGYESIRKIDTHGIITTVAGGGTSLADNIPATNANLGLVNGLTIDRAGNMYVGTELWVRKIDPTGIITTIAGNGTAGWTGDGGPATAAEVAGAYDVAVDKAGNVYFTDEKMNCVRKIDTHGIISTIAGTGTTTTGYAGDGGPATAAQFNVPWGLVIDNSDNLYVCDLYNQYVRQINTTTGIINFVAGNGMNGYSGDGGPATAAAYGGPNMAVDCGGNLFLPGSYSRLRKVTYINTPQFNAAIDTIPTICGNAPPVSIDTLLAAADGDVSTPLYWSVETGPTHGTILGVVYTGITTGATLTPTGLFYKPAGDGYSGIDSFTISVGYCNQVADWRTIYVKQKPLPLILPISGLSGVCVDSNITLTDPLPGGVWGESNALAVITGGVVTGLAPGVDTIFYTMTDAVTGCSDTAKNNVQITACTGVGVKPVVPIGIAVYPNPAKDVLYVKGITRSTGYTLRNAVGAMLRMGTLDNSNNSISVTGLVNGIYLLDVTDDLTGYKTTSKIEKW